MGTLGEADEREVCAVSLLLGDGGLDLLLCLLHGCTVTKVHACGQLRVGCAAGPLRIVKLGAI